MEEITVFIIFVFSIFFVIYPLFLENSKTIVSSDKIKSLLTEKELLYKQIKELEMDYDLGNISKIDFKNTRIQIKKEISTIFEKVEKVEVIAVLVKK